MTLFLVGSTNSSTSLAIYKLHNNGVFQFVKEIDACNCNLSTKSVSWITQSSCGSYIYCTNENFMSLSCFKCIYDPNENNFNDLQYINTVTSGGEAPTHLSLSNQSHCSSLFAANYGSGTISVVSVVNSNECLALVDPPAQIVDHSAHPHQVVLSHEGTLLYSCDLGMDSVHTYQVSPDVASAAPLALLCAFRLPAGSGPRHLVLHSNSQFAYVACELSNQVWVVPVDPQSGCLSDEGSGRLAVPYTTIASGSSAANMAVAEILLSADSRFLYVSNRDVLSSSSPRSSVAVFAVSLDGGALQRIQVVSTRGNHPRHMCLTANGSRLVVANSNSNNLAVFSVDTRSGLIDESSCVVTQTEQFTEAPAFLLEVRGSPSLFLIGSTNSQSLIAFWRLDKNGALHFVKYAVNGTDQSCSYACCASWMCQSESGSLVFATNEDRGTLSAFALSLPSTDDSATPALAHINSVESGGAAPTHLALSSDARRLFAANYSGGNISVLSIDTCCGTGELQPPVQIVDHNETAHTHQVVVSRCGSLLYVCDLDKDVVYTYGVATDSPAPLSSAPLCEFRTPGGFGPRHLVQHSTQPFVYLVCETGNVVGVVPVDRRGYVSDLDGPTAQFYSTVPSDKTSNSMGAGEILLSADSRFLYVSNRDVLSSSSPRSSVAVFAVSLDGGALQRIQVVSTRGNHPRHMCLTANGSRLVVANSNSNNLAVFSVDTRSGLIDESSCVVTQTNLHTINPAFLLEMRPKCAGIVSSKTCAKEIHEAHCAFRVGGICLCSLLGDY